MSKLAHCILQHKTTASGRATLKGSAGPAWCFCELVEVRPGPGSARVSRAETWLATQLCLATGSCRCRKASVGLGSLSLRTAHVAVVVGMSARDARAPRAAGAQAPTEPSGMWFAPLCGAGQSHGFRPWSITRLCGGGNLVLYRKVKWMPRGPEMKGKSFVLLTGATGYVGGRLGKALEAAGTALRCLARRPEHLAARFGAGTEIISLSEPGHALGNQLLGSEPQTAECLPG
jgi:hypothetical protein